MHFCRSCFSALISSRYLLVSLIFFNFWFLINRYLSKSMLLNPRCQKSSFLYKQTFLLMRSNWHTKVKVFHESFSYFMKCPWNCISWKNYCITLKEKFHSVFFPLVSCNIEKFIVCCVSATKNYNLKNSHTFQARVTERCTSLSNSSAIFRQNPLKVFMKKLNL